MNFTMSATFLPYTTDLVLALGWTLLHSLWQAFLVYACLRIVLKLWPAASAGTKYNLSFFSLAGIFSWFLVTLYQQLSAVREMHVALDRSGTIALQELSASLPPVYQSQQELSWIFPNLEMSFPFLVTLYISGVGVMIIKLAVDLSQLHQIRKKQVVPIDAAWEHYLQKLVRQLRIPRKVKLLVSQYIQVPVMIGFLKPVILLPAAMLNSLSAEQLEAILLHELAHIKRNDYILNIFQSIVETALFFNPFIWWISKQIRLEREHCCDDMVIAHNVQPMHYAKALVALEEYRLNTNPLAMAAADDKQHLFYRIKRIMEMKTSNLNYSQKLLAVLIIVVGLTAIAWIKPAASQNNMETAVPGDPGPVANMNVLPNPQPFADTVPPPSRKIVINNGDTTREYRRYEDMPEEDRKKMDEAKEKMKEAREQLRNAQQKMREAQREAHNAQRNMNMNMNMDINMNFDSINQNIQKSIKHVNWQAMNDSIKIAMNKVDWRKTHADVEASLKKVDWDKIKAEISAAMKDAHDNIDTAQMNQSIRIGLESAKQAIANINAQGYVHESMAYAREGMEYARKEIERARLHGLKSANRGPKYRPGKLAPMNSRLNYDDGVRASKMEMAQYRELVKKMAADNLIDTSKTFTIEMKKGDLLINGVKQNSDVQDKYRRYLKADQLTIKGEKDNLNVNASN